MTTLALVGAQWGSEGKGVIAGGLAPLVKAAVRVGGPNAGHSLYHDGILYKMRSVPCAWVNYDATLYIGAGAVVNPELLEHELASLPVERRVIIDPRAVLIDHTHEDEEKEIVAQIGSTGEGVGAARIARIRRNGTARLARDYGWSERVVLGNVSTMLDIELENEDDLVMLEGTQGSGLSLYHGSYPHVTSEDTNVSSLLAQAGIPPTKAGHTHLVARTYPIRVAGPSGPMGEEISWDDLIAAGVVDQPEKTTVTKKVRRIAKWSDDVVATAVTLNDPCGIWLTFGDYLAPELRGSRDPDAVMEHPVLGEHIRYVMKRFDVPVLGVGMGPGQYDDGRTDFMVAHLYECSHGEEWDWNWLTSRTPRHYKSVAQF